MQEQSAPPDVDMQRCVSSNLRRASRAITQCYNHWLRPSGLLITQFSLLGSLLQLGEQPMTTLAEEILMDRTTLSRNVQPLERQGWVTVRPDEADRRVQIVAITPAGKDVFMAAIPLWQAAQAQVAEQLGAGNVTRLLEQLQELNTP